MISVLSFIPGNAPRKAAVVVLSLLLCMSLWGCGTAPRASEEEDVLSFSDTDPITLWVVTEQTTADGMNAIAGQLAEQFQAEHENVTIRLDILPTGEAERAAYLETLSGQDGSGPDIYLLPTSTLLTLDSPNPYTYQWITPLIPDVESAMRSGCFADISALYDADSALGKEALSESVMEAGVVDGSRYVLPIRYNMPVLYAFPEDLEALGVEMDLSECSIDEWMQYVISLGDSTLACGAEYAAFYAYQVFSNLIDYDQGAVTLSAEEVEAYLKLFQQLEALIGTEIGHRDTVSVENYAAGYWQQFPARIDALASAPVYAAIAQLEGKSLTMYPLRSTSGETIASVSYYGAVSARCAEPEAAYAFLRLFLLEQAQWEQTRPGPASEQLSGLLEKSWPVRVSGSIAPLWDNLKQQATGYNPLSTVELAEDSLSILNAQIDAVSFPISTDFSSLLFSLNDSGNTPSDADIRALAAEFLQSLQAGLSGQ